MSDPTNDDRNIRFAVIVELLSGVAIFVIAPIGIGSLFLLVVLPKSLQWLLELGLTAIGPFAILTWLAGIGWIIIGRPRVGCALMALRVVSVLVGAVAAERITHGTTPVTI